MKQFFKYVFASMLGVFLSMLVMIFLLIFIVAGILSSAGRDQEEEIKPNAILHITLDKSITERTSKNPWENFDFTSMKSETDLGLNDILKNIEKAKSDDRIKGIYLDISSIEAGIATIEDIRNALIDFKNSKKFIIAYSEIYTQGAYYLAAVADKVYLNPVGYLEFRGFKAQPFFLKGTLAKLEIEPEIIRVGTFKSAVEPLILEKMSDSSRLQTEVFLNSMYEHFLERIAESRNISRDSLFNIADQLLVQDAKDAVKYGLADKLMYKDELLAELKRLTDLKQKDEPNLVSMKVYKSAHKPEGTKLARNKIAIVYASGDIVSGEGEDDEVGSERISAAIREARLDEQVKAIVIRINSPGGSALASDVIWREVMLARAVKPVIASMGDVAASGGYYIACAADTIVAQPNTITGSIGVFGVLLNAEKFFKNKLGITFDMVKTGQFADLGNFTRPMTPAERDIIQRSVNQIYDDFTGKVAEGRKMPVEQVKAIAEGRVWSGKDALRIGLVDLLGGVNDAVLLASQMAKTPEYRIISYPAQKDPIQELIREFSTEAAAYVTKQQTGPAYIYYKQLQDCLKYQGLQARMLFSPQIY